MSSALSVINGAQVARLASVPKLWPNCEYWPVICSAQPAADLPNKDLYHKKFMREMSVFLIPLTIKRGPPQLLQ